LARWQAEWVAAQLREQGVPVDLVPITTRGDHHPGTIRDSGGEGVFTKEIQRALLDGRIDLAVHSLKDLPTGVTPGLVLAAVPERAAAGDALICPAPPLGSSFPTGTEAFPAREGNDSRPLLRLPPQARVGTGSLRRQAQLLHVRRDLNMKDIRGNVETRLGKLLQGEFDALILAEAGLRRLGLAEYITEVLPLDLMLPAVGQGALGLETRADDQTTRQMVATLDDPSTHAAVLAERAMLAALRGGCLAPIAALGCVAGEQLTLTGRVISHDGARLLEARQTAARPEAEILGWHVAEALLAQGAGDLIRAARAV